MDKSYIKFIERKVKNKIFVKKMMLEEKLELKNICLRNRIVMPPMCLLWQGKRALKESQVMN